MHRLGVEHLELEVNVKLRARRQKTVFKEQRSKGFTHYQHCLNVRLIVSTTKFLMFMVFYETNDKTAPPPRDRRTPPKTKK